jgi:hypothetical protein
VLANVNLKLSARLKNQITREARKQGMGIERWMLEAIEREVERRKRFLEYISQAQRTGLDFDAVEADDTRNRVRLWLRDIAAGDKYKTSRRAVRRVR